METSSTNHIDPLLTWQQTTPDTDGWECYRGMSGALHIGSVYHREGEPWHSAFNLLHSPVFEQFPHASLQAAREAVELHYRQALPHLAADARKASA